MSECQNKGKALLLMKINKQKKKVKSGKVPFFFLLKARFVLWWRLLHAMSWCALKNDKFPYKTPLVGWNIITISLAGYIRPRINYTKAIHCLKYVLNYGAASTLFCCQCRLYKWDSFMKANKMAICTPLFSKVPWYWFRRIQNITSSKAKSGVQRVELKLK